MHSALSQFPIVGYQLTAPGGIHALKAGSMLGLIIGLLALLWGAQGITQAAQKAMAAVWNVPGVTRPGFVPRLGRSAEFLAVLLLNVIITTVLAGFATLGGQAWYLRVLAGILTLLVDVGVYMLAFRILTPKTVQTRDLIPGPAAAGLAWAVLQYFGTLLVGHQLRHSSQIYGYFGSILGLLAFLYLAASKLSRRSSAYALTGPRRPVLRATCLAMAKTQEMATHATQRGKDIELTWSEVGHILARAHGAPAG